MRTVSIVPRRNSKAEKSRRPRAKKKKRKPSEDKNMRLVMYARMRKQQ